MQAYRHSGGQSTKVVENAPKTDNFVIRVMIRAIREPGYGKALRSTYKHCNRNTARHKKKFQNYHGNVQASK